MASDVRKLILRQPDQAATERCSSPGYEQCPSAKQYRSDQQDRAHCPFLQESLVQYCAAAPVVKYIPYSEASLSRCGTGSHVYCELYGAMAGPGNGTAASAPEGTDSTPLAHLPDHLWYTKNHMWIGIGADHSCRVGVDAFFTELFGSIDAIGFVTKRGHCLPEVDFTTAGTELRMVFPRRVMITGVNTFLRTNPSRMLSDPYGAGWLFRGLDLEEAPAPLRSPLADGLIPGRESGPWVRTESERLTGFVHDLLSAREGLVTMADGGHYQKKLFTLLDAGQRRDLFDRFFRADVRKEDRR